MCKFAAPALTHMLLASMGLAFVRSKDANGEQVKVLSLLLRASID
jgi:type III secretory pathway component EscT